MHWVSAADMRAATTLEEGVLVPRATQACSRATGEL